MTHNKKGSFKSVLCTGNIKCHVWRWNILACDGWYVTWCWHWNKAFGAVKVMTLVASSYGWIKLQPLLNDPFPARYLAGKQKMVFLSLLFLSLTLTSAGLPLFPLTQPIWWTSGGFNHVIKDRPLTGSRTAPSMNLRPLSGERRHTPPVPWASGGSPALPLGWVQGGRLMRELPASFVLQQNTHWHREGWQVLLSVTLGLCALSEP